MKTIWKLAAEVRNASNEWDGETDQEEVIRDLLRRELTELQEYEQSVADKQDSLRKQIGISGDVENEDSALSADATDTERKQAELRDRVMRD